MAPRKTYRAAIVGLGEIGATPELRGTDLGHLRGIYGRLSHAGAYIDHPRIELVSGSSRNAERRLAFTRNWGVEKVYADWKKMLECEALDIISVATNTPSHAEIVIAAASSGAKVVFVEKPIATNLAAAGEMLQCCEGAGVKLVVNHTRRWDPTYDKARKLIQDSAIGQLSQVDCSWPTGRLACLGTHHFDLVRWIVGAEVDSVVGFIDPTKTPDPGGPEYYDPGGHGVVAFKNNVKAFINGSEALTLPPSVKFTGTSGTILVANNGGHVELWTKDESAFGDAGIAMRQFPVSTRQHYPMLAAVDEMVTFLEGGEEPNSTGLDGYAALEMVIGFHISHKGGNRPIKFPLAGADKDFEVKSR